MNAPLPPDEVQRLETLQSYKILDTPPETAFNRLTTLAAQLFAAPFSLVSLVDADRQWFKACFGVDMRETSRELSFCAYAILSDQVMVVPNTLVDARFVNNGLVTGPPHVRFYAGAPLKTPNGQNLGSLCVMDTVPRQFGTEQRSMLSELAAIVVDELELRQTARELRDSELALRRSEEALRQAKAAVEQANQVLEERVQERTADLAQSQTEILNRLARAAEYRDDDTGQHTQRVARTAALLAGVLGLPPEHIELIQQAAPLHDVGKIAVADFVLLKRDKLRDEEFAMMKTHAERGAAMLSNGRSEVVQMAERIASTHHERWDGKGYPHGLAGEQIPLEGRILAVADVFDALTHERPYKKAWTVAETVAEIARQSGRQFDPRVVEAFLTLPHEDL